MPLITIDNKTFDLPQNNVNVFNDISDSVYGRALKVVKNYMHSIEHNPGETIEDVFNILVEQERQANIDELIENGDNKINEKYAENLAKIETKIKEETVKHYEEKAKERQAKNLKALSDSFAEKWKMTPDKARKDVLNALLGKDYDKTKGKDLQDDFLSKVAKGLKDFDEKDINADPEFLEKVAKYKEQAKALLEYSSSKKELESKNSIDRYVNHNVKVDPDNFYKNNLENDYEYSKIMDEITAEKESVRKEAVKRVDSGKGVKEPLKDAQGVYLRLKQEERQNFREVIEERNSLVSRYKSTNVFSRIARWVLPNSWSEAGKIQDEIDKLDKAVKDAGYKKEDVESVQKEIRGEDTLPNQETVNAQSENVIVEDNETINLQDNLGRDSGSQDLENSEKITESKEVGTKEIAQK